MENLSLMNQK